MSVFVEIAVITVIAALFGFIAHLLRQPAIIGFLIAGIFIGYLERIALTHISLIENLASIGVALLLFLVGLEMDFRELRRVTLPAFLVGFGQIVFTMVIGYVIAVALRFGTLPSLYIALALTFSSTIIVVKLLSEKEDLSSLYGRVSVGILLVQDFVAILALIFLSGVGGGGVAAHAAATVAKGAGLVVFILAASRVLPRFLSTIGRSVEMLYLFGIAWALGIAALAGSMGLSVEVGGFLAGLSLAGSQEHFQLGARLRPLRDFFIILFFVVLGVQAMYGLGAVSLFPAAALALFVLVGNPLIIWLVMGALGYRARTTFLTGITMAQISEFSFVLVALGARLGHVDASVVSLVTLVGIFTIFVSSYFIVYSERLYEIFRPIVKRLELRGKLVEEMPAEVKKTGHTILIGVHRMGQAIMRALSNSGIDFIALDFDPLIVKSLQRMNIPVVYGDVRDTDVQKSVGLSQAGVVISTVPDFKDNVAILHLVKRAGESAARVVVTASDEWHARELYREGADYVILPHFLGGQELASAIHKDASLSSLDELRERDQRALGIYSARRS